MKIFIVSFIICFLPCTVSAVEPPLSENLFNDLSPLRTEEIKTALIKNSVTGISPDSDFSFTVSYPEYGKLTGEAGPWGLYQDEGSWSVKDDIYCARWNQWLDNVERCYRVYVDGDAIFWVTLDGVLQSEDTLIRSLK
ncbi:hypothetical protein MNBD_GAMMA06-384 [hydrothermal vent metagenome]|uniref:Calpain catalytic domain-containing protein n=1 Tax=hydrothermal vent metagenome TaxID=652676 RepID=A0A3B0WLD9_9ZZZZ